MENKSGNFRQSFPTFNSETTTPEESSYNATPVASKYKSLFDAMPIVNGNVVEHPVEVVNNVIAFRAVPVVQLQTPLQANLLKVHAKFLGAMRVLAYPFVWVSECLDSGTMTLRAWNERTPS